MTQAFLSLGANIGCRQSFLSLARSELRKAAGVELVRLSGIFETEPWGKKDQAFFLNQVAEIRTILSPAALLNCCQAVEMRLGREKTSRWGPRTIDIDLLVYGDEVINTPELVLPHSKIGERKFVLLPFAEIAPECVVPGTGKTVAGLLSQCTDTSTVAMYTKR